jgi:hypothetical protein
VTFKREGEKRTIETVLGNPGYGTPYNVLRDDEGVHIRDTPHLIRAVEGFQKKVVAKDIIFLVETRPPNNKSLLHCK